VQRDEQDHQHGRYLHQRHEQQREHDHRSLFAINASLMILIANATAMI
jgi:hypothetical protein